MTDTSRSFDAHAVLTAGGLWQAYVENLPEVQDTHRSLSQLHTRLRKLISEHEGLPLEDIVLTISPRTGDPQLDGELVAARELRREAERLAAQARTAAVPLARRLTSLGVSVRDAGTLLAVSGATVSALLKTD
ncbi:hypothetical protein [Streptomyces sp. NPDC017940]|uniref:hypothetical protein n=1 Tax=Streptomyces sp. NPDC017940 TaxID=3365017 RepID=UPI0037B49E01